MTTGDCTTFSAIIAEAMSGSHVIKIAGYSRMKALVSNGESLTSIPFSAAGHTWVVRFYPNGDSAESQDYLSFYLILDSANSYDVKAVFSLELLEHSKNGRPAAPASYSFTTDLRTFSYKGSLWGYNKFIHQTALEEEPSPHLRDDSFSIRCGIKVFKEIYSTETQGGDRKRFMEVPPSNLRQNLGSLLENMDDGSADVVFEVGEERFSAHRCVLAARSSVFRAELLGAMKENAHRQIQIDDIEPSVFRSLLRFIYTDSLDGMAREEEEAGEEEDLVMAQHLLVAADRYNVERLKLMCEERLCESMGSAMVATSLALAEQHGCHGLKEACLEFLASPSNLLEMMASDGYEHLRISCPSVLRELIARFQTLDMKATREITLGLS